MKFRIAKDKWNSKEFTFAEKGLLSYDKFQHFLGGFIFAFIFSFFTSCYIGSVLSILFWFLWEIKDAILDWEDGYCTHFPIKYNWGGDGFSYKDFIAACGGVILFGLLMDLV